MLVAIRPEVNNFKHVNDLEGSIMEPMFLPGLKWKYNIAWGVKPLINYFF